MKEMEQPRLEVDIGNSRTKWRFGDETGFMPGVVIPTTRGRPERICISCVASGRDLIGESFEKTFGIRPEFAQPSAHLAGVTCGYDDPTLLGVDRWLAVVAGWNATKRPTVVADLGTAVTIDFVTHSGKHTGGYIVPGLGLMASVLAKDTAKVRVVGALASELLPGRNTVQAVRRGTTAMLLSFVESSVARFSEECGDTPAVFLTGGDASIASDRLSIVTQVESDLVLDGLRLALP
jgi:type III pantothenate kinase